jgi:hypothetical protein
MTARGLWITGILGVSLKGWGLTLRSEYYRRNALDCLRLANTTSDVHSKAMLIDMAQAWGKLAEQAESFHSRPYRHVALGSVAGFRESA